MCRGTRARRYISAITMSRSFGTMMKATNELFLRRLSAINFEFVSYGLLRKKNLLIKFEFPRVRGIRVLCHLPSKIVSLHCQVIERLGRLSAAYDECECSAFIKLRGGIFPSRKGLLFGLTPNELFLQTPRKSFPLLLFSAVFLENNGTVKQRL